MEPSTSHRSTWIMSLLNTEIFQNTIRNNLLEIFQEDTPTNPLPAWQRNEPPSLPCIYSNVQWSKSGWDIIDSKGLHCAYRYGRNQENWRNGHPEGEGNGAIDMEPLPLGSCIWHRQDPFFLPIKETKTYERDIKRHKMVCITKTPGENNV